MISWTPPSCKKFSTIPDFLQQKYFEISKKFCRCFAASASFYLF